MAADLPLGADPDGEGDVHATLIRYTPDNEDLSDRVAMIWRITKGSLINKIVIILPIALLLSWIAPWALAARAQG